MTKKYKVLAVNNYFDNDNLLIIQKDGSSRHLVHYKEYLTVGIIISYLEEHGHNIHKCDISSVDYDGLNGKFITTKFSLN